MFNINATKSFNEVHAEVVARADRMLPDEIVHVSDLTMDVAGHISGTHTPSFRLNDWSRKQLASLLGIRWNKWFSTVTPEERAEEISRRFQRTPGELKIRAWRDDTGTADGVARAFLSPNYTAIDDARVFERLAMNLRGGLDEFRFSSTDETDSTTLYDAVRADSMDLDGDVLYPGWRLRNSEVAGAALTLDDYFLRQVCANGMVVALKSRSLYRTHRHIEDDHLSAAMVLALGRLPIRWKAALEMMRVSRGIEVPHPDAVVGAVGRAAVLFRSASGWSFRTPMGTAVEAS